ncbi:hypothetical protein MY1884_009586 [Beauveria asiatica]
MQPTTFFLLAGATSSLASPAVPVRQVASNKASPAEFQLFSQYAQAAYCTALFDTTINTAVCADNRGSVCDAFKGTVTVKEFTNIEFGTIAGYAATSPSKKHIVVAFKGTDPMSFVDVTTDLTKNLVAAKMYTNFFRSNLFPACARCSIHNGFMRAFSSLRAELEQTLRAELAKPGQESYRVVITGHSLGGAVATVAAPYLRARGIACDLYTYGSPRVGNQEFANLITNDGGFSARITNGNDFVASVPFGSLAQLGLYAHSYPEYWYKDGLLGTAGGYETTATRCASKEKCGGPTCGRARNPLEFPAARLTCSIGDHSNYVDPELLLCKDVRKGKSRERSITADEFQQFLEAQEKEEEEKQQQ